MSESDSVLDYIVARVQEPSTWVSLGSLATAVGFIISPEHWQMIAGIGMGVGGLLGVILRERRRTTAGEIKSVVEAVTKPEAIKTRQPEEASLDAGMRSSKEDK